MCLPMAISVIGGVMSAVSGVMAAQAQAQAYEAQAAMARNNARLAEKQGVEELRKGAREAKAFRREAEQFQGGQLAALAGSGAQMSGSPLNVMADTAMGIEEDAAMLRYNVLGRKYERDVQAVNFRNQANAADAAASNARSAGWWGGITSILGTAQSVIGMSAGSPTGSSVNGGQITLGGQGGGGKTTFRNGSGTGALYGQTYDMFWKNGGPPIIKRKWWDFDFPD